MKNRKTLIFACLALLLAGAVGLALRNRPVPEGTSVPGIAVCPSAQGAPLRAVLPVASKAVPAAAPAAVTNAVMASVPNAQTPTARGTLPYVLTSARPFDKPLRLVAEKLGAKTVSSVSRNALLVEATPDVRTRLKADASFEDVVELSPSQKLQPALAARVAEGAPAVEVSITALDARDRATVIAALEQHGGAVLTGCINEGDTIRAKIPASCVTDLVARGEIRWMETFERPKFLNDIAVDEPQMNVRTVWETHGLTGKGQHISTSDTGIDTGDRATLHEDLRAQVKDIQVVSNCSATDTNGHGTHTAGSIVGNGTKSDGKIKGTAYEANLYAWFCAGASDSVHTPDTLQELYQNGGAWTTALHSASWGSAVNGQYISACVDHDRYVWQHPEYLPVFAAGNEGCNQAGTVIYSSTISSPGSAKNVLTVGATQNGAERSGEEAYDGGWGNGDSTVTAAFSSRGPCQDGRIKPDIAAPGVGIVSTRSHGVDYSYGIYDEFYAYDSGTSMATPLTAGAVALVRQWLVEQKGFADEDGKRPTAALLKAVITGGAKGASKPNNNQGWGRVDLEETLFPSGGRAVKLIDRIPFAAGWSTNIVIETTNAAPLDVQLVWVDYPGSASGSQSLSRLVNDLDLIVEPYSEDGGALYYGNGGTEPDTLNNVESVRIASAPVTKYVITVDCKTILHDHTEGGAAALYIRGAFDPDATASEPECVKLKKADQWFFTLDGALAAVREPEETVEIARPTRLRKSVTVPSDCTLTTNVVGDLAPVVRSVSGAVVTVPAGVSMTVSGVTFTNACAGFSSAGTLAVRDGTSFDTLASVDVAAGGQATFEKTAFLGDGPSVTVAANGEVRFDTVSLAGDFGDVAVAANGKAYFDTVTVGGAFGAVTVAADGWANFNEVSAAGNAGGLSVADGGAVQFESCTFAGAATADWSVTGALTLSGTQLAAGQAATVSETGCLTLNGGVTGLARITLEAASKDVLKLAGALSEPIEVFAAGAAEDGDTFGSFTCDAATAGESAAFFIDGLDEEGELAGKAYAEDGSLRWAQTTWTRAQAMSYTVTDAGATTNYYRKLNSLLKAVFGTMDHPKANPPAQTEIVIYDDTATGGLLLKDVFAPTGAVTLRAEEAGTSYTVTLNDISGFSVGAEASLTVRDLVFDGEGQAFTSWSSKANDDPAGDASIFQIQGGALTLQSGAGVTNAWFDGRSGAVELFGGTFTMESGATIADCHVKPGCAGSYAGTAYGGAVDVIRGTFALRGGTIADCSAYGERHGGGVYVMSEYYDDARMQVSGDARVTGCVAGTEGGEAAENVTVGYADDACRGLELAGALGAKARIGVTAWDGVGVRASTNDVFAVVAEDLRTDAELAGFAGKFINDRYPATFFGTNTADGAQLVWAGQAYSFKRDPLDPDVTIRLISDGGAETNYYGSINEAFTDVKGPVTVEICQAPRVHPETHAICASVMTNDVTVAWPTVIRCADDVSPEGFYDVRDDAGQVLWREAFGALRREASCTFVVTSTLTATNVFLDGGAVHVATSAMKYDSTDPYAARDDVDYRTLGNFIYVKGGELILENGTRVANSHGDDSRGSGMIAVDGGRLTARGVTELYNAENFYMDADAIRRGAGGALLADNGSVVSLDGCRIHDCRAASGAGIELANASVLTLSGGTRVYGNSAWDYDVESGAYAYATNNVTLADEASRIEIAAPVTNAVGVTHGFGVVETNVFAYVTADVVSADAAAVSNLAASAVFFTNDVTGVCGVMLTNAVGKAVFAWWNPAATNAASASRMAVDWTYPGENEASTWTQATEPSLVLPAAPSEPEPGPEPTVEPTPIAFESVTKNAEGKWVLVLTNTVTGCRYRLLSTTDLSKGFTTTGAWNTAGQDGPWTNTVEATSEASFWKAEAEGSED